MKQKFIYVTLVLISASLLASGCAVFGKPADSEFCRELDSHQGFARCQTKEVVCYKLAAGSQCWPSVQSSPAPSVTPIVRTSPPAKKPATK